jgi:hypothetical protein
MAVHIGAAIDRDGDYFGTALSRCARLMDAAHGGQVLVSPAAARVAGESLGQGLSLRFLSDHRLPDLEGAEPVFQLLAEGLQSDFFDPIRTALAEVPVREIMIATGLALSSARMVKSGRLVPHARHWFALAKLAGIPDVLETGIASTSSLGDSTATQEGQAPSTSDAAAREHWMRAELRPPPRQPRGGRRQLHAASTVTTQC